MSEKKLEQINGEIIMADILVRLKALEELLIEKGLISKEEFKQKSENIATQLIKSFLQKTNAPDDIGEVVKNIINKPN